MRVAGFARFLLVPAAIAAAVAGCTDGEPEFEAEVLFNPANGRVEVALTRSLADGERLFVQTRRGTLGAPDCAAVMAQGEEVTAAIDSRYVGPAVPSELLQPFYGPEWAEEPTPAMLAALALGTDAIVDACVMQGDTAVIAIEADLFQTIDAGRAAGLGGKADDATSGEVRIASAQKYGERCVAELGEIPFFTKTAEGSYSTFNCLDATPIPMTVTADNGTVTMPTETASRCDKPQFIYSSCEQGPRVASRTNDQGTRWVLLCRKSIGGLASSQFNDIAMIGNNPYTGKTCFFQNALYQKKDGANIPHPADVEKSTNLWSGVHGGIGSGIECSKCHDADAFVHSPWIDGALDNSGRQIVPKMGVDEDYPMGANDAPYHLVNAAGQGWAAQKHITDERAAACTKCHRMGKGYQWKTYASRLDGSNTTWKGLLTTPYRTFEKIHWMPLDLTGLTEATWATSEYGQALAFIKNCAKDATDAACASAPIPQTLEGSTGGALRTPLPNLTDDELATQSLQIIEDTGCEQCHGITQRMLRDWDDLTDAAEATCLSTTGGGTPVPATETQSVTLTQNQWALYGPFDVAGGAQFTVTMTGTGDADLHVKKGSEVSTTNYDCRPYGGTSEETCGSGQFANTGPGQFWVGVNGFGASSAVTLTITYARPGSGQQTPADMIACMRAVPTDAASPFTPTTVGIYATASHLGWFGDLFRAAYPVETFGEDGWALRYGQFKSRVSMPKGNHPRLTQAQVDVVAEWFARDLPRIGTYLSDDGGPTSCTASVTPAIASHAVTMATQGWSRRNRDAGISMYGCTGVAASNPLGCLTGDTNAASTAYGATWASALPNSTIRVLRELNFTTYFWMRSSADGRFVANGGGANGGSTISDVQRDADIAVSAAYDPGFFPDNQGWVFQGTPIGTGFCSTSVLTANPTSIDFTQAACSSVSGIPLYQHLGRGLANGDYAAVTSQFTSDNGGGSATLSNPSAGFSANAQMLITPMTFDGAHYQSQAGIAVATPFAGDTVLSPSTQLAISRFGSPDGNQLGYVLTKLTQVGASITTQEVGRYCGVGGKPAISFDERYAVLHKYVEDNDVSAQELGYANAAAAGFAPFKTKGAANLFVVDLVTGTRTRITTMAPGQYALYPHFRSDGWIYFLVKDDNTGTEYASAADGALRLANPVVEEPAQVLDGVSFTGPQATAALRAANLATTAQFTAAGLTGAPRTLIVNGRVWATLAAVANTAGIGAATMTRLKTMGANF